MKKLTLRYDDINSRYKNVENLLNYLLKKSNIKDNEKLNGYMVIETENLNYKIQYNKLDFQIPVAINTKLTYKIGSVFFDFYFIVIPYTNSTVIMSLVPNGIPDSIVQKLDSCFKSNLRMLNFVEAIMSCCNDWYIKPSIIKTMSCEKREFFLNDSIFINERKFFEDYDISIFDELRKRFLSDVGDFSQEEERKLNYIPCRESFKLRSEKMIKKILSI